MTYLLDSSAWLAHLFDEPDAEQVNTLFDDPQNDVNISVLSIPEVYMRMKSLAQETEWPKVWAAYSMLFSKILPADEAVAHQAIHLRLTTVNRLPTVDALIAATAVIHQMTLVHREPHLAAIPPQHLRQIHLEAP